MAHLRKCTPEHPGAYKCPFVSNCGYSTNRNDHLAKHMAVCTEEEVSQPDPTPKRSRLRPEARTEVTLWKAYPLVKEDVAEYKANLGGDTWADNTIREIISMFGNKTAPKEVATSVRALDEYMQAMAQRPIGKSCLANYINIAKNAILVRIWRYSITSNEVPEVQAKLGVLSKAAALEATKATLQEISLYIQDPQAPARIWSDLRHAWASKFQTMKDVLHTHASNPPDTVDQLELRDAEAYIIAGMLLFHPTQRMEVFQSLVFLPGASHEDILVKVPRSGKHQARSLLRNRFEADHYMYPVGFYIIVLDDNSQQVPQEVPLVNAVSLLLSFRLICRFERFQCGATKTATSCLGTTNTISSTA